MRRSARWSAGLLVGLLWLVPSLGLAQPAPKVYHVGFLANAFETSDGPLFEIFLEGLRRLGYVEGQNFVIDWRSSEGDFDKLPGLAQDLVRLKVDIIVASSTPAARAAAEVTKTIPIVFPVGTTAAGQALLAGPQGSASNVTGIASYDAQEQNARLLGLLKEAVPKGTRMAVLTNPANSSHLQLMAREIPAAAEPLKLSMIPLEIRSLGEIEPALDAAVRNRADSLYVLGDPLSFIHRARIAELAVQRRLPTIHTGRAGVEAGGLLSYGPRLAEIWARAAGYVDKILKGARPRDLPVDRAPKLEIVLNLKTARAIGLALPPALVRRADEVIR